MSPLYKRCTKCGKEYPVTLEFWYRAKTSLRSDCKSCCREYMRQRYRNNPLVREKTKRNARQWRLDNLDKSRDNWRRSYRKHRKRHLFRSKNWQIRYPQKQRTYQRRWLAKSGKIREYNNRRRTRKRFAHGTHTALEIKLLFLQQKGVCWWCLADITAGFHVDHRIPLSRGGTNELANIVLACPSCNLKKHNKLPDEWMGRLL